MSIKPSGTRSTYVIITICFFAAVSAPKLLAEEVYYRWTDSSGNIQLSDRPPSNGIAFERISSQSSKSASPPKTSQPESLPAGAKRAIGETATREISPPKDLALCESAKSNLEALDNYVRIRVQDESGAFRILSPEEKEAERDKAMKIMRDNCD
ncbi:MAG: DUF4124 domain-containing protein [Halioglobus sp.]